MENTMNNGTAMVNPQGMNNTTTVQKKERRCLNPIAKWILIGFGAATTVGIIGYCLVTKKEVPTQAVEKVAEVTTEVAAAV